MMRWAGATPQCGTRWSGRRWALCQGILEFKAGHKAAGIRERQAYSCLAPGA